MSSTPGNEAKEEAIGPSEEQGESSPPETGPDFLVVGIGASAGGLAAFEAFFSAMPANPDARMAFVLVQHLAPDHKSLLAELVRRFTSMEVVEVQDGVKVQPNIAYIIPPNRDLTLQDGALRLSEPVAPRGQRLPVDILFRSLARAHGHRAIGIVLSGTGADGTLGVRAIKGEGGMAMAQNPASTEFDGMPRSAIATGLVDYVLPPAEMPAELLAYAARISTRTISSPPPSGAVKADFEAIFQLLQNQTGHDFSQYKQSTIARRIERRIAVRRLEDLPSYVGFLRQTPDEVGALFRDLLIGVTQFFRDTSAFTTLETEVIPQLIADRAAGSAIRVWVPGCSTGEEAYSVAMLLQEKLGELKQSPKVQVFATDIDARAIEVARAGIYSDTIVADVTPERLLRHFVQLDDGRYRVHKGIRELLIFSEQDVARDPPFSKLDLITCRNLMIYMGPELQKKLLPLFHYALRPGGALFLGASETVGGFGELFSTTNREGKLYRREDPRDGASRPDLGNVRSSPGGLGPRAAPQRPAGPKALSLRELTQRALLEEAPVAALVNEDGDLLYVHGKSGEYLELAQGEVGVNILKMAREGLRLDLTSALYKAKSTKARVDRPGLLFKAGRDIAVVDLTVQPVGEKDAASGAPLFLVTFEPVTPPGSGLAEKRALPGVGEDDPRFLALQLELQAKDDYLRAAEGAMQTSNEELKSSNEELQSTNEELQSTNEELETSKEELQSVNEELATLNAELQSKVSDLSTTNNDMNNLLASTGIGTLFVDQRMLVRRFTPAVTEFVNLIQTDIGRPLAHIVTNFAGYDRLVADVKTVLDTLTPQKIEVQTRAGTSCAVRIRPYRTSENAVDGAVVTFTEVMGQRDAQAAIRASDALRGLAGATRDALDAITVQDLEGGILAWNPGAVRMYGWSEAEALVMNIRSLVPEAQRDDALAVIERLSRATVLQPYHTQRIGKNGHVVEVTLTATALVNASGAVYAVSTTERGMNN